MYNSGSFFVSICFIFGAIPVSTAQQSTVLPLFGLENTIHEMIKAEVSRQIKASQELIKRDLNHVQQDVNKVTEDLSNSLQGKYFTQ